MNVIYEHGGSHDVEEIEMSPDERARLAPTGPGSTDGARAGPLAALARLAAGVAHEIDHPSEVLRANAQSTETYLAALVRLVHAYEELVAAVTGRNQSATTEQLRRIEQLRDAEDVDFILDDLRSLLRESREGAARLRGLATRLTALSREETLPDGAALTARVDEAVRPSRAA